MSNLIKKEVFDGQKLQEGGTIQKI